MTIDLGGNIQLVGFKELDPASLIIVKKMVGNYVRKYNDHVKVDQVVLTMKKVHDIEDHSKFEVAGRVHSGGKVYNSDMTDYNVFVVLDKVMANIQTEVAKQ